MVILINKMRKIIIYALSLFLHSVRSFELALSEKFGVDLTKGSLRTDIPRTGSVSIDGKLLHYQFHGSSCSIEEKNINYYIVANSENRIAVSLFYFAVFLKSISEDEEVQKIKPTAPLELEKFFISLANEGIINFSANSDGIFELNESRIQRAFSNL